MSNSDRAELEKRLLRLAALTPEERRIALQELLAETQEATKPQQLRGLPLFDTDARPRSRVTNRSDPSEKIRLFTDLFRGRPDVYAVRWVQPGEGKKGYSFACANLWKPGCAKNKKGGKCEGCSIREYLPFDSTVARNHLTGTTGQSKTAKEFAVGAYVLLQDETCRYIVADFDKSGYREDAETFRDECRRMGIPVYLERSRSGNGCHAWVFFETPVAARSARRMMSAALTKAMETRPDMGFDSYDRLIPNQDRMPKGGLGSLVGLPLQKRVRANDCTVFVDDDWVPHEDQWEFLSTIKFMDAEKVERISQTGTGSGAIFGIQTPMAEVYADEPWKMKPSRPITSPPTVGLAGKTIKMTLGDQLYIERSALPTPAISQFARLGAFQNPAFYQAQGLGLWTEDIPRIIAVSEIFPKHVSLPRGCLDDAMSLARQYDAVVDFEDVRQDGISLPDDITFKGELYPRQVLALESLMAHDIGVLKAPPAFGKTVVSIAAIARRRRNTLIIVFTKIVFDQWRKRLKTFLNISPDRIGWIGGGKDRRTGIIDVVLIQTLSRNPAARADIISYVSDIVAEYGHIVVDEAHHIAAPTYEPIVRRAKAKFFLGASATPKRKDGRHPVLFMHLGPVRYQVDPKQMIAESGMAHIYRQRKTKFRFSPDLAERIRAGDANSQEILRALGENEDRNYMIFDDVLRAMDRGRCPIVLTSRKDHLDNLYERFKPFAKNVVVLKGAMKASEKRAAEELMSRPENEERLILATGAFLGEGFDDPRLDALFMTMPTVWEGTLEQYSGRLQRQYVGKSSVEITDYTDDEPSLVKKAVARASVFKRLGFTVAEAETSEPYSEE
ncbi:DEAD/DEAH box helicase [Pararhizobium sp. BT-229]|uniref:DEAD/DEAH box helicase n=1 Tax=Pararhizobium sp. BT-229 TaxID=2986923 RepID=UPI0021F6E1B6|nr:DEAD/DEAH box helicase [Pararhizobium sp. BT-229]MCV9964922.1 DEAD/DEAH box helicase [Pararhizobium sp. BT-229]